MKRSHLVIAEQARKVAAELPTPPVETLAEVIERAGVGWKQAQGAVLTSLSHPHYRSVAASSPTPPTASAKFITAGRKRPTTRKATGGGSSQSTGRC
jgi:hypothetical protein